MTAQLALGLPLEPIPVADPRLCREERIRLGPKARAIYGRLLRGPATHGELHALIGGTAEHPARVPPRVHDVNRWLMWRDGLTSNPITSETTPDGGCVYTLEEW